MTFFAQILILITSQNVAAIAAMLETGIDVSSSVDGQGPPPLVYAASLGNVNIVRMLAVSPGVILDAPVSLIHFCT